MKKSFKSCLTSKKSVPRRSSVREPLSQDQISATAPWPPLPPYFNLPTKDFKDICSTFRILAMYWSYLSLHITFNFE